MKQILFCSRLAEELTADARDGRCPQDLDNRARAARARHSAYGVSGLFIRHADSLLGALEGVPVYVDRMLAQLTRDGWFTHLKVLSDRPIREREYSQLALSLIDTASHPQPLRRNRTSLAARSTLETIDHRTARRILRSLRATHGLHTPPARESFLHNIQVGRLKAF